MVTECQQASCQMTHDQEGRALHSQALNGAEDSGSPGGDAEGRHPCSPRVLALPLPAPPRQLRGLPTLQEGGTNQLFQGPAWETNHSHSRRPTVDTSTQALCGFPETHAAGWAPPCPTAAPRPGVDDASRPTAQAASRGLATASGESSNMCQGGLHCPLLHLLPPRPAAASLPYFSGNSQSHPPGRLTAKPPPL